MRYEIDTGRMKKFNGLPYLYNGLSEFCRNFTRNNSQFHTKSGKRAAALQMGPLFLEKKLSISLSNAWVR
jgi:hypothetical protein